MAKEQKSNNGANLGFEAKLFLTADKLRGSMDASEYKHVALGLVFFKYIPPFFFHIIDSRLDLRQNDSTPQRIINRVDFGCR